MPYPYKMPNSRLEVNCSVFVYGTLKPGQQNYDRYCGDRVVYHEPASVPGRLYHLTPGYPGLTYETGWVQGILLHFQTAEVLTGLDELETFTPGAPPSQNLYQREWQQIYHPDRTPLAWAWLYRMSLEQVIALEGIWVPEGIWDPMQFSN